MQENYSPSVVFWKDFAFACISFIWKTSKVKSNHLFIIFEKKNLGLIFWAKNFLTLLKRITDT